MQPPLQPRLSLITLGVRDLARARKFYEQGLGWKAHPSLSSDEVVFFQLDNIILSLYPRSNLAKDGNIPDNNADFGGIVLAYNTRNREEVDLVLRQAEQAGGQILKPGYDVFWGGYIGYFTDTEGLPWEVAWNPGFPMDTDGTVRLP